MVALVGGFFWFFLVLLCRFLEVESWEDGFFCGLKKGALRRSGGCSSCYCF